MTASTSSTTPRGRGAEPMGVVAPRPENRPRRFIPPVDGDGSEGCMWALAFRGRRGSVRVSVGEHSSNSTYLRLTSATALGRPDRFAAPGGCPYTGLPVSPTYRLHRSVEG